MRQLASLITYTLLCGCASTQLTNNTVEVSTVIEDLYTRQALENISKFVDNRSSIPSQVTVVAGTVQTVNTVNPSTTFPFTDQLARTLTASGTPSIQNARTTAGAGATLSATNTQQQNFTVTPTSDALVLRNQQAIFRHAVWGESNFKTEYAPPKIVFGNVFYLDPFQLQYPHCVLCSKSNATFVEDSQSLEVNSRLKSAWVYVDDGLNVKTQERTTETLVNLGHYGGHDILIKKNDLDKGVLSDFVLFTLPYAEPAETFSASKPSSLIAEKNVQTANPGRSVIPKTPAPRLLAPQPSAPTGPAVNQRILPPNQLNLTIPQTIIQ